MSLAERYNVSKWEMFMTHLESLFSDSKYVKMECFGNNNEHEYSLNYSVSIQFINVSLSIFNFFFSLSTKEIQERVNKLEIMNTLLQDPSKVSVCLCVTLINIKWYCFREWVMEFKVGVWDGNLSRQNHSTWQIN